MFTLNCKGRLLTIIDPIVMGIINVTPDSFYKGSRLTEVDTVLLEVTKMINEGADIIDVGGQSTRPGSERLTAKQELERILPAIEIILKNYPDTIISVDTYQSEVALEAVKNGALIINDISAGNMDTEMHGTVASLHVPYICMHMQGTPENMQKNPVYENVTGEVLDFFIKKTDECKSAGIHDIIIDPGFGFGKTIQHNFHLLKELSALKMIGKPIMAGLSRKSTIYKTLGTDAENALNGSTVMNTIALLNGANILRVHDVRQAKEAIRLHSAYLSS